MFVHRIDPIFGQLGGMYLWWYGLSYAVGFLGFHCWFRWRRSKLGFTMREVWDLSVVVPFCVLVMGRAIEVAFYEWPYYRAHPARIPMLWLGGMSTHGLLLGGVVGATVFCVRNHKSFIRLADEMVIPGALLLGLGRMGNFIDGQIVGSLTTMPWGVQFPDVPGFRHPVVLYDGIKNLALVPLLIAMRDRRVRRGVGFATFLFLYAALRLPIDLYREYPTRLFGIATGQVLNLVLALAGLLLIVFFKTQPQIRLHEVREHETSNGIAVRQILFVVLLACCLTIPSDWTQDVPARYGARHPGMERSVLYPAADQPARPR